MKILAIGIFVIVIAGVLLFTIKVVKSPDFFQAVQAPSSTHSSTSQKIFVDVKNYFSFSYPETWSMTDPARIPGYAPIFNSGTGYAAVGTDRLAAKRSTDEEIEAFSTDIPVQKAINTLVGTSTDIQITKTDKLTYASSIPGFIFEYNGSVDGQRVIDGRIYFYRNGNQITYAFSAQTVTGAVSPHAIIDPFIVEADHALKSMVLN